MNADLLSRSRVLAVLIAGILEVAAALQAAPAATETIAVTEYINDPSGSQATQEWVELYNYGTAAVDIGGWHLKDQDSDLVTIPTGTVMPAKSFLIMARDKAAFEQKWLGGATSAQAFITAVGTSRFQIRRVMKSCSRMPQAQFAGKLPMGPETARAAQHFTRVMIFPLRTGTMA